MNTISSEIRRNVCGRGWNIFFSWNLSFGKYCLISNSRSFLPVLLPMRFGSLTGEISPMVALPIDCRLSEIIRGLELIIIVIKFKIRELWEAMRAHI